MILDSAVLYCITSKMRTPHRKPNRCPAHPGAVLREKLSLLGVNKTAVAKALKMSRNQLYLILREKQPVTPETAVKLAAALGGTARRWLKIQSEYDLWHAERQIDVADIACLR
jgi:addiction module HigA family antidote